MTWTSGVAAAANKTVTFHARVENVGPVQAFSAGAAPDVPGSCPAAHVTGSAMVVDPASRRFLLLLHALLGRWLQPGGHADGDGALPGVAWREATEETGIAGLAVATPAVDVDIHLVPPPHGPVLHLDVRYLVVAPPGAVPRANHESRGLRWLAYDQLPAHGEQA